MVLEDESDDDDIDPSKKTKDGNKSNAALTSQQSDKDLHPLSSSRLSSHSKDSSRGGSKDTSRPSTPPSTPGDGSPEASQGKRGQSMYNMRPGGSNELCYYPYPTPLL